jgi:hypothetical protein
VCPIQLQHCLTQNHPALVKKLKEYFYTEYDSLEHMKLQNIGKFQQEGIMIMETSYGIAFLTTKKKLHGIGETLVKPHILHGAKTVLRESSEDTLKKISSLHSHSKVPTQDRTSGSRKDKIISISFHQL